jgi:hypothetical protein
MGLGRMDFDIEFIQFFGPNFAQQRVISRRSGFPTRGDAMQYGNAHCPAEAHGYEVLQGGTRKTLVLFKGRKYDATRP